MLIRVTNSVLSALILIGCGGYSRFIQHPPSSGTMTLPCTKRRLPWRLGTNLDQGYGVCICLRQVTFFRLTGWHWATNLNWCSNGKTHFTNCCVWSTFMVSPPRDFFPVIFHQNYVSFFCSCFLLQLPVIAMMLQLAMCSNDFVT